MTVNQPIVDQQRGGTHRERFLQLQAELREFSEGAVPKEYEEILHRFLTEFERTRLETEAQIMKLQKELSFVEGTHRACITVANTLVSVIRRYREDLKRGVPPPTTEATPEKPKNGNGSPSDMELLKTICICGCQDEEDAADCKCSCHKGVPCDQEHCVVCATKKERLKAATVKKALPGKKPAKKAASKKAPAKKKSAKKKATKKSPKTAW